MNSGITSAGGMICMRYSCSSSLMFRHWRKSPLCPKDALMVGSARAAVNDFTVSEAIPVIVVSKTRCGGFFASSMATYALHTENIFVINNFHATLIFDSDSYSKYWALKYMAEQLTTDLPLLVRNFFVFKDITKVFIQIILIIRSSMIRNINNFCISLRIFEMCFKLRGSLEEIEQPIIFVYWLVTFLFGKISQSYLDKCFW